jgi:uncharacterized membrane protein YkoI
VRNTLRLGAALCGAALLAGGCTEAPQSIADAAVTGPATTSAGPPGTPGSLREPAVTAQEAQATALAAVGGGWILETKIEERDDDPDGDRDENADDDFEAPVDVWEVTIVSTDGLRRTVSVDLTGGKVLDSRVDDD